MLCAMCCVKCVVCCVLCAFWCVVCASVLCLFRTDTVLLSFFLRYSQAFVRFRGEGAPPPSSTEREATTTGGGAKEAAEFVQEKSSAEGAIIDGVKRVIGVEVVKMDTVE